MNRCRCMIVTAPWLAVQAGFHTARNLFSDSQLDNSSSSEAFMLLRAGGRARYTVKGVEGAVVELGTAHDAPVEQRVQLLLPVHLALAAAARRRAGTRSRQRAPADGAVYRRPCAQQRTLRVRTYIRGGAIALPGGAGEGRAWLDKYVIIRRHSTLFLRQKALHTRPVLHVRCSMSHTGCFVQGSCPALPQNSTLLSEIVHNFTLPGSDGRLGKLPAEQRRGGKAWRTAVPRASQRVRVVTVGVQQGNRQQSSSDPTTGSTARGGALSRDCLAAVSWRERLEALELAFRGGARTGRRRALERIPASSTATNTALCTEGGRAAHDCCAGPATATATCSCVARQPEVWVVGKRKRLGLHDAVLMQRHQTEHTVICRQARAAHLLRGDSTMLAAKGQADGRRNARTRSQVLQEMIMMHSPLDLNRRVSGFKTPHYGCDNALM